VSQIRLENVTRIFTRASFGGRFMPIRSRGLVGNQYDRAFAERAAAHARSEGDARRGAGSDITALDQVNLTIPDGQTFAVVGPSGCGKSTLLRVVAGLDGDYTGEVYYDNQPMRDASPKDRYIGMVFQNYALYPHFEGHGNLSFFFRVRKAPSAEAEKRIRATAEIMGFGFNALLGRKPGTLSGGQQQRLAIGRALVRNPRLFLFDEPLSNLDAKLRAQTRVEIKRLLRRFAITAIYVTHDQEEAVALGDQIAVMREGKIEQVGAFSDLQESPANAFVAGFLGKYPMNLLAGKVDAAGRLSLAGVAVALPPALRSRYGVGEMLTLGIRSEAARLTLDGPAEADGVHLPGEVEMVEPDLARRRLIVFLRTGPHVYAVAADPDRWPKAGERLAAFFPADRLYFFDGFTGARVQ